MAVKNRAQLEAILVLDQSVAVQHLRWAGATLRGDLSHAVWQNTPVTFELGFLAPLVGLLLAIPIGIYSAIRQDTVSDRVARTLSINADAGRNANEYHLLLLRYLIRARVHQALQHGA